MCHVEEPTFLQIQEQSWSASIFHTLNQSHSCYGDPKCQGPLRIAQLSPHPASVSSSAERRGLRTLCIQCCPEGRPRQSKNASTASSGLQEQARPPRGRPGLGVQPAPSHTSKYQKHGWEVNRTQVPCVSLPPQSAHRLLVPHRASLCVRRPGCRAGRQQTLDKYLQIVCGDKA